MVREKITENIIQCALDMFDNPGVVWSGGKDSTLLLHFVRKFNDSLPVIFVDTYVHFDETYEFIEKVRDEWNLNLHIARAEKNRISELIHDREKCCHYHKTMPFRNMIKKLKLDAVFVAIRWDEHPERAKEKYFSKRDDHWRVHPILHWTEKDIWDFTLKNKLPIHPLYHVGYRSFDCQPCASPVCEGEVWKNLDKGAERAGRSKDKEEIMRRLRELGYF